MRKLYILFLLPVFWFVACNNGKNNFTITGNIEDIPEQTVYLEAFNINDMITVIDSAKVDKKGRFELSGSGTEYNLYRIRFQYNKFVLLSLDKGNVKIESNWQDLENYTVTGSPASSNLKSFLLVVREHLRDFNTMGIAMDTFTARGNDSMLAAVKKDLAEMNFAFTRYIEQYADTNKYLPNALFAVQMLNPAVEKDYISTFVQNLGSRFPQSKLAHDFAEKYGRVIASEQQQKTSTTGPQIGGMAPDLNLPDANGQDITISSFKGKYLLVDFWASWCGPCRHENPNVVAAYNKYKGKNFTILGISLDSDKDKWQEAVKKDGLSWTHVSDLKGWESVAAQTYGVEAIPANFLVDPSGHIVARDLRGEELDAKLAEVLK